MELSADDRRHPISRVRCLRPCLASGFWRAPDRRRSSSKVWSGRSSRFLNPTRHLNWKLLAYDPTSSFSNAFGDEPFVAANKSSLRL